ncbi:MAG TPA: response regulator transcription factor [Planctomycetota bacterium]|nr:response regulator transcription factor [Planctomycetota bacterium]
MTAKKTVLVVEDDPAIRRGLVDALQFAGYAVIACADGQEGLDTALTAQLDLAILDIVLPRRDGFEILHEVRGARPALPVILVTARGAEQDRVHGLQTGADDYVVKPFSSKELLARVAAVLRRSAERPSDVGCIVLAGRAIDFDRREVARADGTRVLLSEKEGELLRYLVQNRGRAIARKELLERVWGLPSGDTSTRAIDMHIVHLREKLADPPERPEVVLTVRGKGYMLASGASP